MSASSSKNANHGYALLSVVGVVTALLIAGVATISLVRSQLHFTALQTAAKTAYYIAEAGVQRGIAQLDNDAATATTVGYVYPTIATTAFGGGTYDVSIAQDPLFPSNRTRKQITSTGTFLGTQATIVTHVTVQAPMTAACASDPCCGNVVVSTASTADVYLTHLVAAATTLFNGNIYSNRDARFTSLLALGNGIGNVSTTRHFYSEAGLLFSPTVTGNLTRGGNYIKIGAALNGQYSFTNGTGTSPASAIPSLPSVDFDAAKREAQQIVNSDNYSSVAAGSSWSGGTWSVSTLSLDDATRYYVDGNVRVTGLELLGNRSAEIWTKGSIEIGSFTVVNALAAQNLTLVAGGDITFGDGILGGGLANALTNTKLLLVSTAGGVQLWNSIADVAGSARACLLAGGGNVSYRRLASVLSSPLTAIR